MMICFDCISKGYYKTQSSRLYLDYCKLCEKESNCLNIETNNKAMDKTKLKELLESEELKELRQEYVKDATQTLESFLIWVDRKRKELETQTYKTEDGYIATVGEMCFMVNNNTITDWMIHQHNLPDYKMFKLKRNAENYLVENAECLSLNDVIKIEREIITLKVNCSHWDYYKQKIRQKLGL